MKIEDTGEKTATKKRVRVCMCDCSDFSVVLLYCFAVPHRFVLN